MTLVEQQSQCYKSRKPKWWTQLSNRRGTRAQRQSIQRMTQRGYCLSRDILIDFGRVSNNCNRQQQHQQSEGAAAGDLDSTESRINEWKRAWWNKSLGIGATTNTTCGINEGGDDNDKSAAINPNIGIDDLISSSNNNSSKKNNEKYAQKLQDMYSYKCPLLPYKQYKEIWLEIGFGNGDNILANSKQYKDDVLFIGCEIHQPGVGAVLRQMEMEIYGKNDDDNLDRAEIIQPTSFQASSSYYQNIRIVPCDGIKLLSHLPNNYIDKILVTFPDPWPNECHVQWRVIQREVLREMHRVLKCCGGGRVYVATDDECFYDWARMIFHQESMSCDDAAIDGENRDGTNKKDHGATTQDDDQSTIECRWKEIVPTPERASWLPVVSHYEQKGLDEGRCTMLQCWEKCNS